MLRESCERLELTRFVLSMPKILLDEDGVIDAGYHVYRFVRFDYNEGGIPVLIVNFEFYKLEEDGSYNLWMRSCAF